jgi:hypothetical protein
VARDPKDAVLRPAAVWSGMSYPRSPSPASSGIPSRTTASRPRLARAAWGWSMRPTICGSAAKSR